MCIDADRSSCLEPLAELLPKDIPTLYTVSPNYVSRATDNFAIIDGDSHKVLGVTVSKDAAGHEHGIFAPRGKLREVLMHNLKIYKGKQCIMFEENDTGVTATFSDGTSAQGTILIGADGARSIVRRQLFENDPCVPSAYIMFNGNVTLPKHLYKPVLAHSTCGPLIGTPDVKFHLVLSHYQADETAVFNWNCSWRSYDYAKDDSWAKSASAQEILDFALQKIKHFPPEIIESVAQTDLSGVQCPPLSLLEVVLPEARLPTRRVTLLGDAAHAMVSSHLVGRKQDPLNSKQVPFRGMGANTALLDACDLGRSLIAAHAQGEDLSSAISAYEKTMVSRGRRAVLASRAAGESGAAEALSGDRLNGDS